MLLQATAVFSWNCLRCAHTRRTCYGRHEAWTRPLVGRCIDIARMLQGRYVTGAQEADIGSISML